MEEGVSAPPPCVGLGGGGREPKNVARRTHQRPWFTPSCTEYLLKHMARSSEAHRRSILTAGTINFPHSGTTTLARIETLLSG